MFFSVPADESAEWIGHGACVRHCWEVPEGDDKQNQDGLFPMELTQHGKTVILPTLTTQEQSCVRGSGMPESA